MMQHRKIERLAECYGTLRDYLHFWREIHVILGEPGFMHVFIHFVRYETFVITACRYNCKIFHLIDFVPLCTYPLALTLLFAQHINLNAGAILSWLKIALKWISTQFSTILILILLSLSVCS